MKNNKKEDRMEATLLTFKVALDVKGNIWTDIGGLPLTEIKHIFKKPEDAHVIRILIREGTIKLQTLHKYLEDEITAIHYVE